MSEVFEQVMAQCARGSFTGLLRVQTRGGRGEIRFLSGIQDEIRFDGLLGDAALERLQAADEAEFEAIQSLPPLDPGGSAPVPIEGPLERIHAAQLMRYCEANSLTCALELEVKGAVLTARYRLGELLSVEPDSELTAQLAEAKQGAYRFRLPRFELPAGAPRASNGSAAALHAPVPVTAGQIRTSANPAQPATPAVRATPQSRPTPAATPAARNLHAAPTPVSTPAPKIAPVAPLPVGNSGSAKTARAPAATPVAAPLASPTNSAAARPAARAASPTPVAAGTRPATTTARPGAAIQAKPVTSVGASPAAAAKARGGIAQPAAPAQPAEPANAPGAEPAAAVHVEPAAPRAEAARIATAPSAEVAGRGPRERAEQITARSTPQRTPAAPQSAARTARANGEDAAVVAASARDVAKPARAPEAPMAEQSRARPWLVLAVLIALAIAGWMAFGSPLPGH